MDASLIQPEIPITEYLEVIPFEATYYPNFQGHIHLPKLSKVESSLLPDPLVFPGCSAKRREAGEQIFENKVVEINSCQNAIVIKNNSE